MQGCARCIGAGLHVFVPHPAAATALHLRLQGQLPRAPLPGQAQIRPQESHTDLLPLPFRSAVVRSSRWRRRRPSGRHPSSKPSDNAASPSAASLRRPVPEILIACHPSSSAIRARSPRSVVLPEPRGPARRMRRPGAPGPSQIPSRKPSPTDALSLWKAVKTSIRRLFWNRTVSTMAHPSFGSRCPEPAERNSPDIGERARQPRVFRAWKESSRTSRESSAGITPMSAPFSAMWARHKWHMQGSSLTERLCRSQTGSALSPIPICRRQAFMYAISPKASFPPAVSVARYRQIAWPQASPSSAWCRFPICACFLASLKRRICCTYIRTGTASQCCVSIFAHAHPLS